MKEIIITISNEEYEQLFKISELMTKTYKERLEETFSNLTTEAFNPETIAMTAFSEGLQTMNGLWDLEETI